jgi:hypothetical protein
MRIEGANQTSELGSDKSYFVEDLVKLVKDTNILVREAVAKPSAVKKATGPIWRYKIPSREG